MIEPIRMSSPDLDDSDEAAVLTALRSGELSLGSFTEEFERLSAERAGTRYAVAASSGTAGLHMIVKGVGIDAGSEVLVPSFTFAASLNAFLYEGAVPVFVDIEPEGYNLNPDELSARRSPRTTSVMVVDAFGHPADWGAIASAVPDLILIDDCCEALGATYRGRPIGSFGAAGCFAFYANKQITTGEGGMVVTDDPELASTVRALRNQGRGEMGGVAPARQGRVQLPDERALGSTRCLPDTAARFVSLQARRRCAYVFRAPVGIRLGANPQR